MSTNETPELVFELYLDVNQGEYVVTTGMRIFDLVSMDALYLCLERHLFGLGSKGKYFLIPVNRSGGVLAWDTEDEHAIFQKIDGAYSPYTPRFFELLDAYMQRLTPARRRAFKPLSRVLANVL